MITLDDLRDYVATLPGVEEKPHFGKPAFRVRNKLFVSVHLEDPSAIVHVDETTATSAADDDPAIFQPVWREHGGKRLFVGLRLDLASVAAERCRQLVEAAWRHRAPKRLVDGHDDGG